MRVHELIVKLQSLSPDATVSLRTEFVYGSDRGGEWNDWIVCETGELDEVSADGTVVLTSKPMDAALGKAVTMDEESDPF